MNVWTAAAVESSSIVFLKHSLSISCYSKKKMDFSAAAAVESSSVFINSSPIIAFVSLSIDICNDIATQNDQITMLSLYIYGCC